MYLPYDKWITIKTLQSYGKLKEVDKFIMEGIVKGELVLQIKTEKKYRIKKCEKK